MLRASFISHKARVRASSLQSFLAILMKAGESSFKTINHGVNVQCDSFHVLPGTSGFERILFGMDLEPQRMKSISTGTALGQGSLQAAWSTLVTRQGAAKWGAEACETEGCMEGRFEKGSGWRGWRQMRGQRKTDALRKSAGKEQLPPCFLPVCSG